MLGNNNDVCVILPRITREIIMARSVKHYTKEGKVHKGASHKMPNGHLHSGKSHTASSKRLFHYGDLSKKAQSTARKSWR